MRIRTKILFLVLPLIVTPLVLSGLVSALEARNGITRVAADFLRFKAEELRKYASQQWGILEENSLADDPRYVEIAREAVASFAAGIIRSPTELVAAFDSSGSLVLSTSPLEIPDSEASALERLISEGRVGWEHVRLGGADRVAQASVFPEFGWYVLVSEREDRFYSAVDEILRRSVYILAGSALLSVVLLLAFSGYLTGPIVRLERTMTQVMETNDLSLRAEARFSDEIGRLAGSFNDMVSALDEANVRIKDYAAKAVHAQRRERKVRSIFQKYVPVSVIDQIFERPESALTGEERVLTVLFSDIVGFTSIAEHLKPADLVDSLNHYFERMGEIILGQSGIVDKYIGDAIMGFFGAPASTGRDVLDGVEAGLRMQEALEEFNRWQKARGRPAFQTGVGLNHGSVTVGNIGFEKKMDYTAIGDMVNTASRIEGLTRLYKEPLLVSSSVWREVRTKFPCRFVDKVAVKGRRGAVSVFAARREIGPEEEKVWKYFHAGVKRYYGRAFREAAGYFAAAAKLKPGDSGAERFLGRCRECLRNPPPAEWTGIQVMRDK